MRQGRRTSQPVLSHLAELIRQGGVGTDNGKEGIMDARLNLFGNPVAAKFLGHIVSAGKAVSGSTL